MIKKVHLFSIAFLLISISSIYAQSSTFDSPGDWDNSGNWSNGIPDSTKNAIIDESNCKVNIVDATCKNLDLVESILKVEAGQGLKIHGDLMIGFFSSLENDGSLEILGDLYQGGDRRLEVSGGIELSNGGNLGFGNVIIEEEEEGEGQD